MNASFTCSTHCSALFRQSTVPLFNNSSPTFPVLRFHCSVPLTSVPLSVYGSSQSVPPLPCLLFHCLMFHCYCVSLCSTFHRFISWFAQFHSSVSVPPLTCAFPVSFRSTVPMFHRSSVSRSDPPPRSVYAVPLYRSVTFHPQTATFPHISLRFRAFSLLHFPSSGQNRSKHVRSRSQQVT